MGNENAGSTVTSGNASPDLIASLTSAASSAAAQPAGQQGTPPAQPSQPSETGGTPQGQTTKPGQPQTPQGQQPGQQQGQGAVPQDRHQSAVRNARETGREDVFEYFGIPFDMEPQVLQTALTRSSALERDPLAFYHQLGRELQERGLLDREGRLPSGEFRLPDPDLHSPDRSQSAYSAKAVANIIESLREDLTRQFRASTFPMRTRMENFDERDRADSEARNRRAEVTRVAEQARSLPHFKDNEEAINNVIRQMDPIEKRRLQRRGGPMAVVTRAYNHVMETVVIPNLTKGNGTTQRQGNGQSINNGQVVGGGTNTQPSEIRGVDGLMKHMQHLEQNWVPR